MCWGLQLVGSPSPPAFECFCPSGWTPTLDQDGEGLLLAPRGPGRTLGVVTQACQSDRSQVRKCQAGKGAFLGKHPALPAKGGPWSRGALASFINFRFGRRLILVQPWARHPGWRQPLQPGMTHHIPDSCPSKKPHPGGPGPGCRRGEHNASSTEELSTRVDPLPLAYPAGPTAQGTHRGRS